MPHVLSHALQARRRGHMVAVATVTHTEGSVAARVGARVALTQDGPAHGTLGGGLMEHKVVLKARELLAAGTGHHRATYPAGEGGCGGSVEVFIEVWAAPTTVWLGGPHKDAVAWWLHTLDIAIVDDLDRAVHAWWTGTTTPPAGTTAVPAGLQPEEQGAWIAATLLAGRTR